VLLQPVLVYTEFGLVGALSSGQAQYMLASPLSLAQSVNIVWPHLTTLISLCAVCFGISYILFMREEIRA
jgi:ABC-2 type transport system permease protein